MVRSILATSAIVMLGVFAPDAFAGDTLYPGESLGAGNFMSSSNGCFNLWMQNDGNLVIYRASDGNPVWPTGTNNISVEKAIMQHDGNFVLYRYDGHPAWATGTDGHDGARIVIQGDGNLVIYAPVTNRPLWASNSVTHC